MSFLLTSYIYPLTEKISISAHLKLYLDNPRTKEEINFVKECLAEAYEINNGVRFPPYSDEPIVTLENLLFDSRDCFKSEDQKVKRIFKIYKRERIFDFIAKMWVIARFDDEGESERLKKAHKRMRKSGSTGFFLLEDEHPLVKNSKTLVDYSYLLSLLAHSENKDYFGRGFMYEVDVTDRPITNLWHDFMMFGIISNSYSKGIHQTDPLCWTFLPYGLNNLKAAGERLNKAFADGLKEKLLYIGNILSIVGKEAREPKVRIVMLTSIIELLLTHNPNTNRFNVEDSINKQFQLKASILIYLNDKSKNIKSIQQRLKTIYEQRSNIAHGNFSSLNKFIGNLSKKGGQEA